MSTSSVYSIHGMTCESCVKTIVERVSAIPEVQSAKVSLEKKNVEIVASKAVGLNQVKQVLADLTKYQVSEADTPSAASETSWLKTYKPLLIVFAFIFLVSSAYQLSLGHFHSHVFMNHIMAGFFIGLSLFKFLDLKAFSESFSSYDPLAQRWPGYAYIYPFIEVMLGLLFIAGKELLFANGATVIVLAVTSYGVYKRLQSKSKFQCACLGTAFSLPLSNVTIFENVVMIAMAGYGLIKMLGS